MNGKSLTVAEWKVMKIVWRLRSCSAREVHEEVRAASGWAPSTTKSRLRRLIEKGHLTATPVGTSFLYRAARPAWQALAGAADTLLDNTPDGMHGRLLAYMMTMSRLTPEVRAQLLAMLDQRAAGEISEVKVQSSSRS
jgi:BlaI family transcriptional regulator, penicillinase repressor